MLVIIFHALASSTLFQVVCGWVIFVHNLYDLVVTHMYLTSHPAIP